MGIFNVNPEAELKKGFPAMRPGVYRMRVAEVTDRSADSENPKPDFKVKLAYADPSQLVLLDGQPFTGTLEEAGSVYDYIMQDPAKQWKLKAITLGAGLPWVDYDVVTDLVGRELDVKIKTEEYQGNISNKVDRYMVTE